MVFESGVRSSSRTLLIGALIILVLGGFGLRSMELSAEGLSDDELNKLHAVADYRANGLTAANSEHPMLMKALQTVSILASESWNRNVTGLQLSTETALRLPGVILGALTTILIFLIVTQLFGDQVGLLAAALWAFDPNAIGFNRIAKEDTFLLFFFLLANVFWLRGQRVAESKTGRRPEPYYWATAAAFGAMMASKYVPQLIAVSITYYWMFQAIPETRWRLGKKRILTFLLIIGLVFLILSPTILLPDTWRQMGNFASQKKVTHDGYEFMGTLYTHRLTDWLQGTPWYFYLVFIAVKLPLLTLAGFLIGLPLLFRRKVGDGRYFILMWMFVWLMTFTFAGGKFTRYFTTVLPAVLITAALGVYLTGLWIGKQLASFGGSKGLRHYAPAVLALLVVIGSITSSIVASPHFRLYTNLIGGGWTKAGYYFPHDEFYDGALRDVVFEIARSASPGSQIASETPRLAAHYARVAGRQDLTFVSLSDPETLKQLRPGDFVVIARGRRYFSNDAIISALTQASTPAFTVNQGFAPAAKIFILDEASLEAIRSPSLATKLDLNGRPIVKVMALRPVGNVHAIDSLGFRLDSEANLER